MHSKRLNLEELQSLAARIAHRLHAGDAIALSGDLGTGKTAFCRALIQAIAPDAPEVTSPTFMLMQSYPVLLAHRMPEILWHLDLYRLKHASEAQELGLDELWKHVVVIEWPEIIAPMLPPGCLHIALAYVPSDEGHREVSIILNDAWRERLGAIW